MLGEIWRLREGDVSPSLCQWVWTDVQLGLLCGSCSLLADPQLTGFTVRTFMWSVHFTNKA